jgi:hypothetical protein
VDPLQATLRSSEYSNAFVAELNAAGSALVYSTYLGGSGGWDGGDQGQGIAVDSSGNAYVAGVTGSADFPTVSPLQASLNGAMDAFVAKISAGAPVPLVICSPTSLTFGPQNVDTASPPQTVTVTNIGTPNLTISTVAVGGTNASDFAKSADACTGATITSKGTCTVSVTFSPSAAGNRSASLSFTDNASGSPQIVNLTGTGVAAFPAANVAPSSLTFGNTNLGSTSAPQAVTLSNTGNAALSVSGIAASVNFAAANNCAGSVAAGGSCTINVTFTPTASGTLNGTLTITDNSSGVAGTTQTVALTGIGIAPVAVVSPASLTFGSQVLGTPSPSQRVTLSNLGNATLTITSITASRDFSQTNNCEWGVAAGASCTINVTFTPTAKGTRKGTISIADNATGSPQVVTLIGVGTVVKLSPLALSFGRQPLRTASSPRTVTLMNTGNTSLNISGISIRPVGGVGGAPPGPNLGWGPRPADFAETNNCRTPLAPGASCATSVTFTPQTVGLARGLLAISDDGGGSPQRVPLFGVGM